MGRIFNCRLSHVMDNISVHYLMLWVIYFSLYNKTLRYGSYIKGNLSLAVDHILANTLCIANAYFSN